MSENTRSFDVMTPEEPRERFLRMYVPPRPLPAPCGRWDDDTGDEYKCGLADGHVGPHDDRGHLFISIADEERCAGIVETLTRPDGVRYRFCHACRQTARLGQYAETLQHAPRCQEVRR